jgi:hypothetical protein
MRLVTVSCEEEQASFAIEGSVNLKQSIDKKYISGDRRKRKLCLSPVEILKEQVGKKRCLLY